MRFYNIAYDYQNQAVYPIHSNGDSCVESTIGTMWHFMSYFKAMHNLRWKNCLLLKFST